ncbi:glycosyltransferase [Nitrospira defluvii]|nr:glycosyltransferase [Nitrospira defluvii]
MTELPRISIVTPSFNQAQYLTETIESILGQDYPNLEYIVIDGGSTDGSVDIIRRYEDHLAYWCSEKDEGQSDAINKGFSRATGKLLCWLNSDDVFFPGALRKIGAAYVKFPRASIYVGGNAIGETENGGIRKCSIPTKPLNIFSRYGLLGFGQQSTFFNADVYRQVGCLNRDLYMRMDGDIIFRLIRYNPTAVLIGDMIGFIRWHGASKSTLSVDRYLRERDEFIKSLDISRSELSMRKLVFKMYRFFSGGYLKSWLATRRYKGKRMSEVWLDCKGYLNEDI